MQTGLIIGMAIILGIYKIIEKILTLIEWNMKYGVIPVKEKRVSRWDSL